MATVAEAREQLSRDIGDFYEDTTTSVGNASGIDLIDTRLSEEDPDAFIGDTTERAVTASIESGAQIDEERAISVLATSTLTMKRAFGGQILSGVKYQVHRGFNAENKDDAITEALDLMWPTVFKEVIAADVTIVANQKDYSVPSGFFDNIPHSVELVSTVDTEDTIILFGWRMLNGKVHFDNLPATGRKVRMIGIAKKALSDYVVGGDLLVLSSRAAIYLYESASSDNPADLTGRFQGILQMHQSRLTTRTVKYTRARPAITRVTQSLRSMGSGRDWGVL